jgi:ABC-type uncharacterized transport system substrate-binding protein
MTKRKPWLWPTFAAALAGALLAALPGRPASAHPHAWIDVAVEVLFDASGKIAGLRENWLFDEFYTAFAMEGLGKDGKAPSQQDIDTILAQNMRNLKDYRYFTKVEHDGREVAFTPPTEMSSRLNGARLEMSFVVPFDLPLTLGGKPVTYAVFDPTYYIEMLHAEAKEAIRLKAAPAGCSFRLIKASPSLDTVAFAAALDRTQSAGDGLGALFAERVEVRCP